MKTTGRARNWRMGFILSTILASFVLQSTLAPAGASAKEAPDLKQRQAQFLLAKAVSFTKPDHVIPARAQEYFSDFFAERAGETDTLKFWVFFTDKGSKAEALMSDGSLNSIQLERSRARRAKVSRDNTLFVDLPVEESYVEAIERLGAVRLAVSRWLNAAAFRLLPDGQSALEQIAALPSTLEIRPSARAVRPNSEIPQALESQNPENEDSGPQRSPLSPAVLNYGLSHEQLLQVGATVGHDSGYTGEGVTLAMFDTGYRKSHQAFLFAYAQNRVLAEWDFINNDGNTANEGSDPSSQWNHGTLTWSTAGALWDNNVYGPAYNATFLLAKTENVASETIQEEYDWVAALEWADSLGADIVSSSLAYMDWYTYADLDGLTAVTTLATNTATNLGIVVCNAMGNSGSAGAGSLNAPADAFDMLACGAVDSKGLIAGFSSRGPTADGRIKPEVCARGVSTICAGPGSDNVLTQASGTSLSTPLVAGVTAQLIQARPTFPPQLIIRALTETASQADSPDNTYGNGIINLAAALQWGVNFTVNGEKNTTVVTEPNTTVQFADASELIASSWNWTFGDGAASSAQNPSHQYTTPGVYDVTLGIQTGDGDFSRPRPGAVVVQADTISLSADTAYAGQTVTISVALHNTLPLSAIRIPLDFSLFPAITFDSVGPGARSAGFSAPSVSAYNSGAMTVTGTSAAVDSALSPGDGEVMRFYFTLDDLVLGGSAGLVSVGGSQSASLTSNGASYAPQDLPANVTVREVIRGDSDGNGRINVGDAVAIIHWLFTGENPPLTVQSGDADGNGSVIIDDAVYLVNYIFIGGPPPPSP